MGPGSMEGLKIQVSNTMESASRTIWPVPDISQAQGDIPPAWRERHLSGMEGEMELDHGGRKGARERGSAGARERRRGGGGGGGGEERERKREREREREIERESE